MALFVAALVTGRQLICTATAGVGVGVVAGPEEEDLMADFTAENSSFYY
jgi:hypothetical protein